MAKKKPMVGDRYCKNPRMFSGNRQAPYEKRMSGIDVVRPAPMRRRPIGVRFSIKVHEVVTIAVANYRGNFSKLHLCIFIILYMR